MKAYVKPDLFCEDYVLTMTVANCSNKVNTTTRTCAVYDFGGVDTSDIVIDGTDGPAATTEIYCYTNNVEALGIFHS